MGSRYGGLKQMDGLGPSGETIIDYSVFDAIRAGFGKIVFVIKESIREDFIHIVGSRFEKHIPVEYVMQELDKIPAGTLTHPERVKPWGTAHAMMMGETVIQEPFAVINADDFYGASAFQALADFLSTPHPDETTAYCMVGYQLKNTLSDFGSVSRGVCEVDEANHLIQVTERTKIERNEAGVIEFQDEEGQLFPLGEETPVSMNMWGCHPGVFAHSLRYFKDFLLSRGQELKSEFYIPIVMTRLIEEEGVKLTVLRTDAEWFGVTYKEDRPVVVSRIQQLVDEGKYPADLWGVKVS